MAYYLGKNAPGDLASVLNGAYKSSSPNTSVPTTGGEPPTPQNTTTGGATDCDQRCRAEGYKSGTPEFVECVNQCKNEGGNGGGGGGGGEGSKDWIRCSTLCLRKGLRLGEPGWDECFNNCTKGGGGGKEGEPCPDGKCATGFTCVDGVCHSGDWNKCSTKCLREGFRLGSDGWDQCFNNCIKGGGEYCDATNPCTPPKVCKNGQCVEQPRFCDADNPCTPPQVCVNGKCTEAPPPPPPGNCPPEAAGAKTYTKNPAGCPCGTGWSSTTTNCGDPKLYYFVKRNDPSNWKDEFPYKEGAIGTCQCTAYREDWEKNKKDKLGEYKFPPEMQALMDLLLSRGKEFMGLTPGYSQEAQDKMFGRGFENVRGQETGQRKALESGLSKQGMLGTGAGQGMLNDLSWQTEGNVANLARDLFVGNEEKKKSDLIDYTNAAQGVLGGGMSYAQLLEAINSARRGEGSSALQALLAWLLAQQ